MFLLNIKGKISGQVRDDLTSMDLRNQIVESLREVGLAHVELIGSKVLFRRNLQMPFPPRRPVSTQARSQFFLVSNRGDFLVESRDGQASVHYDISTIKLWLIASPLIVLFTLLVWVSGEARPIDKYLMAIWSILLLFGGNYVVLMVGTRIFLRRCIRKSSAQTDCRSMSEPPS